MTGVKSGRVAIYIEGHAESLVAASDEGVAAQDRLAASTDRVAEAQAAGSKGFASYTTTTKKHAAEADKAAASTEHQAEKTGLLTEQATGAGKAIGGMIAAYAGYEAISGAAEYTEELVHQTRLLESATGLDSKAASQWIELAKQRQIEAQKLQIGFGSLSKQIAGAESGSTTAAKGFHALGIPLKELRGLSTEEVLFKVSDGLKGMNNEAQKAALTQQFFGKSGRALLPVLELGSKGLKEQLGAFSGLSEKQEEQGEKVAELERKVSRAYDSIRLKVTFALLEAGEATEGWIKETVNGEGVVGKFGATAVKAFDEVAEGKGKVGSVLHEVVEDAKDAVVWTEKAATATVNFTKAVFQGEGGEAGSIIRTVVEDYKDVEVWAGKAYLTAVKFAAGLVGGAVKAAPSVFNAVVGAVKSVGNWFSTAGHNVSQFVKDFIPFKVAVIAGKVALAPLVLIVLATVKALKVFSPVVRAGAQILKTVFIAALSATGQAIGTFLKVVGDIGSVVGDVVGLVTNLLRGHWGNAWKDAKAIVTDSLHAVEDTVKGVWSQIKNVFNGGMSIVKSVVKHGFAAVEGVVSNAENTLDGAFGSAWDAIKGTFADGVNEVIGFLNTLASVIEKIPGVPSLQIPEITVGGGKTNTGSSSAPEGHGSNAGYARGGHVTRPMFMVGEEAPNHPEWVIATNPAYRKKNVGHWVQAGHDLGVPGFALGGLTNDIGDAASSAFNAAKSVGEAVLNSAKVAIGDLPTPHLPGWMGNLGGYVVGHVADWIKSGFSSGKLGEKEANVAGGLSGNRFRIGAQELGRIGAPSVISLALFEALVDEGGPESNVLEGEGAGTGAPIMSAAREISGFLTGSPTWTGTSAMSLADSGKSAYEIAQAVQASGAGAASNGLDNYGSHRAEAESLLRQYGIPGFKEGGSPTRAVAWAENNLGAQQGSRKQQKWAKITHGPEDPWCAEFVGADMVAQGLSLPSDPSGSDSYSNWSDGDVVGSSIADARPGDLLDFSGAHIAIYKGGGQMISGNFSNEVMETSWEQGPAPLSAVIRPKYPNGAASSSSSSASAKHVGPATTKQVHRLEHLEAAGAAVLAEAHQLSHQYAKHGGTDAGKASLERGKKLAKRAAAAHKAGNSEHAKTLIEEAGSNLEKARGAVGVAGKNVYTPALKAGKLGAAAEALPSSLKSILKAPGITFAQKLAVGETAASLAGETESEADDKSAAKYQLGLLKKDKQRVQKRLKEIAKELAKPKLTKAQRNKLLGEQSALSSQLGSDTQGIASARSTLKQRPESETEEEGEGEGGPTQHEVELEAQIAQEQTEREEEAARQEAIKENLEAMVATQKEQAEAQQRTIALLESQSGPNGVVANAIAAVVSGQIGGKVGLGFQTPGIAGKVASY